MFLKKELSIEEREKMKYNNNLLEEDKEEDINND